MAPLSNKQGYELARIATKRGLPVDLQRLIWADVTKNYYLRGSVTERAATLLQAAWRRLGTVLDFLNVHDHLLTSTIEYLRIDRVWELAHDLKRAYKRYQRDRISKSLGLKLTWRRRQPPPMP